jgi:hypothetical protein
VKEEEEQRDRASPLACDALAAHEAHRNGETTSGRGRICRDAQACAEIKHVPLSMCARRCNKRTPRNAPDLKTEKPKSVVADFLGSYIVSNS